MHFLNIKIPEYLISYFVKKVSYVAAVETMQNGQEYRKQIGRRRIIWQLTDSAKPIEVVKALENFFTIVEGRYHSFAMKDPMNYVADLVLCKKISNNAVQLQKITTIQNFNISKKITKPIEGSVTIYKNGVLMLNDYTVDYQTGIVSFVNDIELDEISASFEFYHHVRFDDDMISFNVQRNMFAIDSLKIVEIID